MAIDLSHLIQGGYLFNHQRNRVFGQLFFHGRETPLYLELSGNCDPDLAGRSFEFTLSGTEPWLSPEDEALLERMEDRQIGVVVSVTAARRVRTQAEPGNTEVSKGNVPGWQLGLHLEWHGPNGHAFINAPGPSFSLIDEQGKPLESSDSPSSPAPEALSAPASEWETQEECPPDTWEDKPMIDEAYMQKLMAVDAQMECGDEVPLRDFFEGELQYPRPESLETEEDARQALIQVLAFLARMHIAWDICSHCDYRQAYQLLIEHVCDEAHILPGMNGTGFVTHFSTSDYCPQCEAEFDSEWDKQDNTGDTPPF